MNVAESLIYNVAILFLMLTPGLVMVKCHLSTPGFGKALANLVLYIAQPALIVVAYIRPYDAQIFHNAIWVLIFSVLSHFLFAGVAFLCFKRAEESVRKMLRFATIFSNAAYMGIPLIVGILGDEAAIYASVYGITFNVFIWSLGVLICTGDKKRTSFKKVLFHPTTVATVIGLIFFFLPIDGYVPSLCIEALNMLKQLVAPLSMIIIGLRLTEIKLKGMFRDPYLYQFLALRLLILPAIVFLIMKAFSLLGLPVNEIVMTVILVSASTPAATATSMFAEKFDGNAAYAGKLVAISTILSILSMPIISLLLSI
ncbi:MAG: AEC family transporter [Clostridia bacterium]|nr:AEC family transporter [Clostridia bacterium]